MIKRIVFFMLFCTSVYAGQSVCPDGAGGVSNYFDRGPAIPGCTFYDPPHNTTQIEFDRIFTLFRTVPRQHIKIVAGSPEEMTPAEKTVVNDAIAAQMTLDIRNGAKARMTGFEVDALQLRAFADILKDEINDQRAWLTSFKAEVAASISLADFKIRVAALPNMPQRTLAQLRTAIQSRIDSGAVDS